VTGRDDATRSAERAILGAMLFHPSAIDEALAYLDAEQFADPRHGYVFAAVTGLHARESPAAVPAVLGELARLGNLHGALDGPFVTGLVTDACLTSQVGYYAAIVTREARRRALALAFRSGLHALDVTDGDDLGELAEKLARTVADLAQDAEPSSKARRLVLTSASEIAIRRVSWLWDTTPPGEPPTSHGRIPAYSMTLGGGGPGLGKSQFAAWLTARITTGELPGELFGTPRSVIYAATEDDWSRTIAPRLVAAGADLDLVFRIAVQDDGQAHARLTLPSDISLLGEIASEHSVSLFVADPLLSLIDSGINDYRAAEVRSALEPLVACAGKHMFTIFGLAHWTKNGGADPLGRIAGSGAFGQVVRANISFIRTDGEDGPECLMSQTKNNLGRDDLPSYSYSIEAADVQAVDGVSHVSRFVLGQETNTSVTDVMRAESEPADQGASADAAAWLQDFLTNAGGSEKAPEVKKFAKKEGIADATLYRARKKLGVQAKQEGFGKDRGSTWYLPEAWRADGDD
jgi:DnaB-like helicase N terminal domain/AAA domain